MILSNPQIPKFIKRLMPAAGELELKEAAETFKQYMAIVLRIYGRVRQEQSLSDSRESDSCGRVANDAV